MREKKKKDSKNWNELQRDGKISLMSSKKKGEAELPRNFTGNADSSRRKKAGACKMLLQEKSNKFPLYLVYGFEKFILFARRWWRGEFSTRPLICSAALWRIYGCRTFSIRLFVKQMKTGANRGAQ